MALGRSRDNHISPSTVYGGLTGWLTAQIPNVRTASPPPVAPTPP